MFINKCKLPKSASFVLRSFVLEEAMRSAGISVETRLNHVNSVNFFGAFFWPPNPNVAHERFYVGAGAVPSSEARDARSFVESSVVPQFIAWAKDLLSLPGNSPIRREEQWFVPDIAAYTSRQRQSDGAQ
ncbi:MAG: hypothetical protein LBU46_05500 [Candidatus Accumulibacter sp.]|jgi:hypothetical protein|nr:hypothetical protein [Accumulibacter sp.]